MTIYGNLQSDKSQRLAILALLEGQDPLGSSVPLNLKSRGAIGDGVVVRVAASMTEGSAALTISTLPSGRRAWRVGDLVAVPGAGAGGVMLVAYIRSRSSDTACVLSVAASTTVSSVSVAYGTDDTTAWQTAVSDSIAGLRSLYIPSGIYMITAGASVDGPAVEANASARAGGWGVCGDGLYRSVIFNASTDYALELTSGCDGLSFRQFCIKTWGIGGGGGIKTMEGGNQLYDEFFMDGCGSDKWGIYNQDGYVVTVRSCRFWQEANEFRGGSMFHNSGHTLTIAGTFCSRQCKDGSCIYIADYKGVILDHLTCESNAGALGASFTDQAYIEFDNFCFGVEIRHLHFEGVGWKYGIINRTGAKIDSLHVNSIYAWQKDGGIYSQKDHTLIKLGANDELTYGKLLLKVDDAIEAPTTLATAYVIDDPGHLAVGGTIRLIGTNHTARPWSQWYQPKGKAYVSGGSATANVSATWQLTAGPGTYRVTVNLLKGTTGTLEGNHGRGRSYDITFDDASATDYTSVIALGTGEWSKGTNYPNALNVTVDHAGLITVTTTASTSVNTVVFFGWEKFTDLLL